MNLNMEKLVDKMNIKLKKLKLSDANRRYLSWLQDYEITRYTDQCYIKQSLKVIRNYIQNKNKSKNDYLFGIFVKVKKKYFHIGNIRLSNVNHFHKTGMISLFIGDKNFIGKKIGTKAISKVCNFAKKIGLYKVFAGVYKSNVQSQRSFLKNGFIKEGIQKKQVLFEGRREDLIWYGRWLKILK